MSEKRINYQSIIITTIIALALLAFIALRQKDSLIKYLKPEAVAVGQPAPEFTLAGLDGRMVSLSDYRGKVVWLHVWQVGSLHGREQMRYLQSLHDKYGDKGLAVLGFNCVDDRRIAQTFLRDSSVTFPTVLDSTETARRVVSVGLESRMLDRPLSCIIDREGKLVDAWYDSEKSKRRGAAAFKDVGLEVEME